MSQHIPDPGRPSADPMEHLGPELPPELRRTHRPSGRHPVDVGHLVMGVAFLGLATVWALLASDTLQLSESRWLLPLPWLLAGTVGLIATVVRGRRTP
ncbi:hypothetical protein KG112_11995 [Nocardioides sp. zg-ZUI104]|uniref:hypothetical protein n=1 Tax=Nocardioides faecalis TaxID=2803858 RepID=UPI001BCB0B71|nr:hypothetical protein [Nocardioides faecalis]MBS4753526.1 hypothetical protein [Nocardioides faecalis]